LIAGVESPGMPDLGTWVVGQGVLLEFVTPAHVESWISAGLRPLLAVSIGEFDFVLRDAITEADLGYEPQIALGADGFPPQRFLAGGNKVKPLAGLEESLKAGKALLRGEAPARSEPQVPFEHLEPQAATPEPPKPDLDASSSGKYRFSVRKPNVSGTEAQRQLLLFSPDAQLRVAVRRALSSASIDVHQFHSLEDAVEAVRQNVRDRKYFITVLDCTEPSSSAQSTEIVQLVRRMNVALPVVVLASATTQQSGVLPIHADRELIVERQRSAESPESISSAIAVLERFVEERFWRWERTIAEFQSETAARAEFYDRAEREDTDRKYTLLEALIMELSDPDDLLMIASTLTRAAAEYVDRGAVFSVQPQGFSRLLAFGAAEPEAGAPRRVTIPRSDPSVLLDVSDSARPYRGKIRKTAANMQLLDSLGPGVPTEAIAVPILFGSELVGVFYGDNAKYRQPITETAGLEVFLAQAGRAFQRAMSSARSIEEP
jgi:hypothetical protein